MKHLSNTGAENIPAMGGVGPVGGSGGLPFLGTDELVIDRPRVTPSTASTSSPTPTPSEPRPAPGFDSSANDDPASYRATEEMRETARKRMRLDPAATFLQHQLLQQLDGSSVMDNKAPGGLGGGISPADKGGGPGGPGKGGAGGKGSGEVKPFGPASKQLGQTARDSELPPDPQHPYVQMQNGVRSDLDRLGISTQGNARIHIDDLDYMHAQAVARTAGGQTSLAQGNELSIRIDGASKATQQEVLTKDQRDRLDSVPGRIQQANKGELSSDQMARLGADMLEGTILDKQMRLHEIRGDLANPPDGKKTFVNMSWGQTGEEASNRMTFMMLTAPKGSTAAKEVEGVLGHAPTMKKMPDGRTEIPREEFEAVREKIAYPKMAAALDIPEVKKHFDAARAGLEGELAEGKKQGVLVFQAAGNSFDRAGADHPEMSRSVTDGVRGMLTIGATEINGPGSKDDAVSKFSSDGQISLAAPGSKIPVWQDWDMKENKFKTTDVDGTSFASPYAAQVAAAMSAANPKLSVDQISKLMTDPRALNDIAGTTRDGGGGIDPFAAILLAKNPNLSRAQIDSARDQLHGEHPDVARIKKQLGI